MPLFTSAAGVPRLSGCTHQRAYDRHMVDGGTTPVPDAFDVHVRRSESRVDVVVRGELDLATAPRLRAVLDEVVASGIAELGLDLRALDFMDSSGIAECW
jgi:hypothetical protein